MTLAVFKYLHISQGMTFYHKSARKELVNLSIATMYIILYKKVSLSHIHTHSP